MDLYNFQNIKAEKARAILRYRMMQKVTIVFRFVEFCIFLIVFSRFSVHLPPAFKLSGDYFRGLSVALISPWFVFIVGNAIVIILFLKSGRSSGNNAPTDDGKADLYDEYVKKCAKDQSFQEDNGRIEKQRKQTSVCVSGEEVNPHTYQSKKRKINRSQSESWSVQRREEPSKDLKRSVTVPCRKSEEKAAETDEMSSEEFRRTVEAFIARQQRALREEEFSVFVPCENSYHTLNL
nr:uncharacterized protein LOC113726291 [Ipomoea trifida]